MEKFDNIYDAICDTKAEAMNLTLRSQLMVQLEDTIRSWQLSQRKAATKLGISQPRLNDLLKGKINNFSLDNLVTLCISAGLGINMEVKQAA
jgi:predicted XRE-type DNA-binding protein